MKRFISLAVAFCYAAAVHANPLIILSGSPPSVVATSPGTTNLYAWYDFAADPVPNAQTPGTANLGSSTANAPTYNAGPPSYGISSDSTVTGAATWSSATLGNNFGNAATPLSFVCRFQGKTSGGGPPTSGDFVINGNGSNRTRIEWNSSGIAARICGINVATTVVPSVDNWYTVVVTWDGDTSDGVVKISVNGADFVSSATPNTATPTASTFFFASSASANANPFWVDFAAFYVGRELTLANSKWLHNDGVTRTFSEL